MKREPKCCVCDCTQEIGLLVLAKTRHRKLIQLHHPDAGGAHDVAADLNAALAEAERELGAG